MTLVASRDTTHQEMVGSATERHADDVQPVVPHPSLDRRPDPEGDAPRWSGADALRRAAATVRRSWPLLALTVAAGAAGALVALHAVTPLYRTTTVLLVRPATATTVAGQLDARATAVTRAIGLSQIGGTLPAERRAAEVAGLPGSPPDLGLTVYSSATGSDPFVTITVAGPDPAAVTALARAYVTSLPATATQLQIFSDGTPGLLVLRAPPPPAKTFPPTVRMLLAGVGAGLLLGLGALVTPQLLTRRLRTVQEIEARSGWPVLARIPRRRHGAPPDGPVEGHRQLAAALAETASGLERVEIIDFDERGDAPRLAADLTAALSEREVELPVLPARPAGRPEPAAVGAAVLVLVVVSERRAPSPRDVRLWHRTLTDESYVGLVMIDTSTD